ncbi:hypothetical protein C8R45DRAFT_923892 [Mycena sanguinolenta]|nr:hypothetical protein C8R45DRAFT_923892 [Mycena sanguinolenta]
MEGMEGKEANESEGGVGRQTGSASSCSEMRLGVSNGDGDGTSTSRKGGAVPQYPNPTSRIPLSSACNSPAPPCPCPPSPAPPSPAPPSPLSTNDSTESPSMGDLHAPRGRLNARPLPLKRNSRCRRGFPYLLHAQNTATTTRTSATPHPSASPTIAAALCVSPGAGYGLCLLCVREEVGGRTPVEREVNTCPLEVYSIVVVKSEPEGDGATTPRPRGVTTEVESSVVAVVGASVLKAVGDAMVGAGEGEARVSVPVRDRTLGILQVVNSTKYARVDFTYIDPDDAAALEDGATEEESLGVKSVSARQKADGISVPLLAETEDEVSDPSPVVVAEVELGGESLSDSVVVAESGGEVVLASDVDVVAVESEAESLSDSVVVAEGGEEVAPVFDVVIVVESEAESLSDSVVVAESVEVPASVDVVVKVEVGGELVAVAESGGEVVLVSGVVVVEVGGKSVSDEVVVAESGGVLLISDVVVVVVELGGESLSDSVLVAGGEVLLVSDVAGGATPDGVVSVLVTEVGVETMDDVVVVVLDEVVESVDEALSDTLDVGSDEEATDDDTLSEVDSENAVEDEPLEAD